jgi:hypothetical protein
MRALTNTGPPEMGALRVCETRSVQMNNASGTAGSQTLRRNHAILQGRRP